MVTRAWSRIWTALAVAAGCVACATVAGVEVTRAPGAEPDDRDEDVAADGGVAEDAADDPVAFPIPDGGSDAAPVACGCDAGPTTACCVRSTSSACVAREPGACAEPGAFMLGCVRPDIDGRDCCWNQDGGLRETAFGAGCPTGRAACVVDDDCTSHGGTCHTLTCAGTTFGVCAASSATVPPGLACPP